MKHLIFKDSSAESNMNHQIQDGLATINSILSQYAKTNLPPIQDKSTLQALMANPVTYIGKHLQDATNLSGWKVSHTKLVELLDEPEIKTLLHMTTQATEPQPINTFFDREKRRAERLKNFERYELEMAQKEQELIEKLEKLEARNKSCQVKISYCKISYLLCIKKTALH